MSRQIGIIGLGRMGGGLAAQALEKGYSVAGCDAHVQRGDLEGLGMKPASTVGELSQLLIPPRSVLLLVPAGRTIDTLLEELVEALSPGDLIADCGNSYWGDSVRRHRRLRALGLSFVDVGTSGGVVGARTGACFMVGAEPEVAPRVEALLRPLAVENGFVHAGGPGAGHFTKLVHNGIEFGMLQAIGEGIELLRHFPEPLQIGELLGVWRHGSVIRGWLLDLLYQEWRERGGLDQVPSHVDDTGEVNWLLSDAVQLEVYTPVIAQAVMSLFATRDEDHLWAKAIAAMRHGFGGHAVGHRPELELERRTSQVDARLPELHGR